MTKPSWAGINGTVGAIEKQIDGILERSRHRVHIEIPYRVTNDCSSDQITLGSKHLLHGHYKNRNRNFWQQTMGMLSGDYNPGTLCRTGMERRHRSDDREAGLVKNKKTKKKPQWEPLQYHNTSKIIQK